MTPSLILCMHDLLMTRLDKSIAGEWRDCPVFIGDRVCPFVSQNLINEEVVGVCNKIRASIERKKMKDDTKELHIMFERIHPFLDGNGRIGRMIYNWHRMKLGLPIHIIKADWPKKTGEQVAYYQWFKDLK